MLDLVFEGFRDVWLVDVQADRPPGERPRPERLVARELRTGCGLQLTRSQLTSVPYAVDADALVVTYDAPLLLGCHLARGWALPARVLDLHAEFRCQTAGLLPSEEYTLPAALAHFGLQGEGVEGLERLLAALRPELDLPRAVGFRGRYAAAVARMESTGTPIDTHSFHLLQKGWGQVRDQLIALVDRHYGCFRQGKFLPQHWRQWVNRRHIPWPRTAPRQLDLRLEVFRDMAGAYPEVGPMKDLLAALAQLRGFRLAVGADGRNRCRLRPFASTTGRNQPPTAEFVFGPATWVRGLIKPQAGRAVAYVDYSSQEFGTAAALSRDPAMMAAYASGDPYLTFAQQAGAVPKGATKASHAAEREQFKACCLGAQYGMGAGSLAARLGLEVDDAKDLLRLHRKVYPAYWQWSGGVERQAREEGRLRAALGWTVRVGPESKSRSLRNFPLQANGAEMLRLACIGLTEAGVEVCCPVHDALLVEGPSDGIDAVVAQCQQMMRRASTVVLGGFPLRADAKVFRHPDRYWDPRGERMWRLVFGLLDGQRQRKAA